MSFLLSLFFFRFSFYYKNNVSLSFTFELYLNFSTQFHFCSDFSKQVFESDEKRESRDGEVPLLPLQVVVEVSLPLRVEKAFVELGHFLSRDRLLVHLVRVLLLHHLRNKLLSCLKLKFTSMNPTFQKNVFTLKCCHLIAFILITGIF